MAEPPAKGERSGARMRHARRSTGNQGGSLDWDQGGNQGIPSATPAPDVTPGALRTAALAYLSRYASTTGRLAQVLRRRVERAVRAGAEVDPAQVERWIAEIVQACVHDRLLDDVSYAEAKAIRLRRRGLSARRIAADLAARGLDADTARSALSVVDEGETGPAELTAAHAYARRRRLGPYRAPSERAERRLRDLAAMGRAGFSGEIARRVIDGPDPEP